MRQIFLILFAIYFGIFQDLPSIEITSYTNVKDNDNSETVNAGDTIEYTIEVENISSIPISDLTLTSYFQDIGESSYTENGLTLTFVDTGGSAEGILSVGETAEYTGTYTFDSAATAPSSSYTPPESTYCGLGPLRVIVGLLAKTKECTKAKRKLNFFIFKFKYSVFTQNTTCK